MINTIRIGFTDFNYESSIKVKIWGPIKWTFKRKVFRSKHGPVIKNEPSFCLIAFVLINPRSVPH